MTDLVAFIGRFHPVVLHLPIGALLLAGVFELLGRTRAFSSLRAAAGPSLVIGAVTAIVTAATGYALGSSGGYSGATYEWHLRMGMGVAAASVLTLAARAAASSGTSRVAGTAYGTLLVLTLAQVGAAGHLGGTLTHGEGYLTEHMPAFLRPFAQAPAQAARPDPAQAIVFTAIVQPVLRERCVSCHGPDQAEGRLRLDTEQGIRTGGESGPAIVPGRPDASEIVRRVWLPSSHEDAMPPPGRRAMPVAEAALVRWWVEQGASFDKPLAEFELAPEVQPALEAVLGPIDRSRPAILSLQVPPADPAAIARVEALGVSVAPIAQGTSFLHVHCTNARRSFGDDQVRQLEAIAPQVTWLELSGSGVTDSGLEVLARLPNLTRLHLDRTAVTDVGLAHLAGLSRLEYLNLYGTQVTDAGLDRLKGLVSLRSLHLWGTRATPSGSERLRAAIPRLHVELGLAAATPVPAAQAPPVAAASTTR